MSPLFSSMRCAHLIFGVIKLRTGGGGGGGWDRALEGNLALLRQDYYKKELKKLGCIYFLIEKFPKTMFIQQNCTTRNTVTLIHF
jgi:hypothetical protein